MEWSFNPSFEWGKYKVKWSLYILSVFITLVSSSMTMDVIGMYIILFSSLIAIIVGINRLAFYFDISNKVYVKIAQGYLSMYRGNLFGKKEIPLTEIKHVVNSNEQVILLTENYKEWPIEKNWLTKEDVAKLMEVLNNTSDDK
ncbi:hypothetical protein SH601_11550 [Gracilibacillus sp. S3-1-1]|uniref:Uncharacterized protein n=1 Tax=Gracilibacillus pellucidus TaxID=3095368 RepID=A0ACC6M774_9BACI|nr:hypothetical protein [Gracilibacillus sp. S3-1-1]MDX8046617.1 hypothetical protein [Gracilibacillus sp. S3-1-1]